MSTADVRLVPARRLIVAPVDALFALAPGDGVLYLACESPHWRGEFNGEYHTQAFFHYVDRHGSNADWNPA